MEGVVRKKKRRKQRASQRFNDPVHQKNAKVESIKALIAKLDFLIEHSTGLRHYSYKLRRHVASVVLRETKRSLKDRGPRPGKTQYIVNAKSFQGGAPGLIDQNKR
jgi:hypothetical protein